MAFQLTCPDFLAFSSILILLDAVSSDGVPTVGGLAPTEAGRPIEADEGDLELVGVRLLLGKLGGPCGAWCDGEAEAECFILSSMLEMGGFSSWLDIGGPRGPPALSPAWCCCIKAWMLAPLAAAAAAAAAATAAEVVGGIPG
jgi:hypothetical protein